MFEDDDDDMFEFSSVQVSEEAVRSMMALNQLPIISSSAPVTLPTMQSVLSHIGEVG